MVQEYQSVIIGIVLLFGIYFFATAETPVMSVVRTDSQGLVETEELSLPKSANIAQSLLDLGNKTYDLPLLLQSSIPMDGAEGDIKFDLQVQNPFDEPSTITNLRVFEEEKLIAEQDLQLKIISKGSTSFRTQPITITPNLKVKNKITLTFTIETEDTGRTVTVNYEYVYYALNKCISDGDCASSEVCDRDNVARFSTINNYCVETCNAAIDCASEQICIKGRCGY